MNELDGAGGRLLDDKGRVSVRDIVSFVSLDQVLETGEDLAEVVLQSVRDQFIFYMQSIHFVPKTL